MRRAVLVNGVPAVGKSTVARDVSLLLDAPLLGLDTVKEALFGELGTGDRLYNRKMGRASYAAIWALVADFPPDTIVVVDAWFGFQPAGLLLEHLARADVRGLCEIWCHADPEIIAQRYLDRCGSRHAGHLGTDYVSELRSLAQSAQPFAISTVIRVDTTRPVDAARVIPAIRAALDGPPALQPHSADPGAMAKTLASGGMT